MQGYSPKLPLQYDKAQDGIYGLNKTLADTIKQNLKMLLLTNPGERIMNSDFGVGMKKYLFENDTEEVRLRLISRINEQIKKYLDYVKIEEINISEPNSNEENLMFVNIRYSVPSISLYDELNINP